ncbi:MAG: citramalate synthase [Proteobacteria bacterium]|nr:citramalate synthase [Pseudomonadota bacterium]MBU1688645.1 citramalate synthase [Pseudomonadota bacterium]
MAELVIYDTTLRDGTQAENFNLSTDDKIRITLKLDALGIDYIEGGWPGANPVTTEYFNEIKNYSLRHTRLTAFGSTRNFNNPPEKDPNLQALVEAGTAGITIFGKTWDVHVRDALRIKPEDNLLIIDDSLRFLRSRTQHLFYDAEHFFDGFKGDKEYALATIDRAVGAGADCIVLCDTNGGTLPTELFEIIRTVKEYFLAKDMHPSLGIHAHNDAESAVANSLLAVSLGITQIQGTMNGVGERCGNANLTSIIPALALKMGHSFSAAEHLRELTETSRFVSELANMTPNMFQPYVGAAAFAHKGGIHVSAVQRNPMTYEHIDPELVGNSRRILISDQAGKSNILHKSAKFGIELNSDDPRVASILKELKDLEKQGYQYEGAEASFELLMRKALGTTRRYFDLHGFRVISQKRDVDVPPQDEATVRLEVGGEMVHTAALGAGPVNALDNALRKALTRFYPSLAEMHLKDYKVRVLASDHGTGARVRVLIQTSDNDGEWGTVGVSHDIIEASWQALVDSLTYKLMKDERKLS